MSKAKERIKRPKPAKKKKITDWPARRAEAVIYVSDDETMSQRKRKLAAVKKARGSGEFQGAGSRSKNTRTWGVRNNDAASEAAKSKAPWRPRKRGRIVTRGDVKDGRANTPSDSLPEPKPKIKYHHDVSSVKSTPKSKKSKKPKQKQSRKAVL